MKVVWLAQYTHLYVYNACLYVRMCVWYVQYIRTYVHENLCIHILYVETNITNGLCVCEHNMHVIVRTYVCTYIYFVSYTHIRTYYIRMYKDIVFYAHLCVCTYIHVYVHCVYTTYMHVIHLIHLISPHICSICS